MGLPFAYSRLKAAFCLFPNGHAPERGSKMGLLLAHTGLKAAFACPKHYTLPKNRFQWPENCVILSTVNLKISFRSRYLFDRR